MRQPPFILCASPRQGNSLLAAQTFAAALNVASDAAAGETVTVPPQPEPTRLADFKILPCVDCGACSNLTTVCPQSRLDQSAALFRQLAHAPLVCISAPIYFYHLPSTLKALLDRCQIYWRARERGNIPPRPDAAAAPQALRPRKVCAILLGARERGEQMFSGSLLTLKYSLAPFGLELAEPLLLRGLDKPGDLAGRPDLLQAIRIYGESAATLFPAR